MLIEDLPRLTDEERELADDEYAVMPAAVPTNLSIDDLIARHTAALYAMRTAGADFAAFSESITCWRSPWKGYAAMPVRPATASTKQSSPLGRGLF